MAEVCANTPRITRQQAVVNHLDAGEMHEYSELQSKTTRLTWFFIAPITWFCLRVGPMRATPHSMVCSQNKILRHYDDILPDLSHYKMIYCLTLFIIKWCLIALVMLIHSRTGYQESGCSTPVKAASYGLIGYPMVSSPLAFSTSFPFAT